MHKKLSHLKTVNFRNRCNGFSFYLSVCSLLFLTLFPISVAAQVGINTTEIDFSAILEVESTDKGVLFPSLTIVQRDAINTAAANAGETVPPGLTIYCTDCCANTAVGSLYFYNGVEWKPLDSDCRDINAAPDCIPTTITITDPRHLDPVVSPPLLFDGFLTNGTQPNLGDLKMHHGGEDIWEFALDIDLLPGYQLVLYWSDQERAGDMGLLVDLAEGITVHTSIDTLNNVLPNSTNVANGGDDDYILTIDVTSITDTITVESFDDGFGPDPYLLEVKVLDQNGDEISLIGC